MFGIPDSPVYVGMGKTLVIWDTNGEVKSIECGGVIEVIEINNGMRELLAAEFVEKNGAGDFVSRRLSALYNTRATYIDRVLDALSKLMGIA